jgi:hypothetical protein
MKFRIGKYWQRLLAYMVFLICMEFLIDGRSEYFVHDVILTIAVGSFFIATDYLNKNN